MANGSIVVDVSHLPEVLGLAEEVRASGKSRILRRDDEEVAIIAPVTPARSRSKGKKTQVDYDAFRSAAGGWEDIDTDRLVAAINEDRRGNQ